MRLGSGLGRTAVLLLVSAMVVGVAGLGVAGPRTSWDEGNVRVNDPSDDTFGGPNLGWREPVVAIDPTNPQTIVAGVMNMNSSNAYGGLYSEATQIYRSGDAGRSWTDAGLVHTPGVEEGVWGSGDPSLVFDKQGNLYLATLADEIAIVDDPLGPLYYSVRGGIEVYRSVDRGATWSPPVLAVPRVYDYENQHCAGTDKELLGVNEATGELFIAYSLFHNDCPRSQSAYYSEFALEGFDIEVLLVRSPDGGRTWSAPQQLWRGYALGAQPAVGPDGTIYVVFTANVPLRIDGPCPAAFGSAVQRETSGLDLVVASSFDDGAGWRYEHRPICEGEQHPSITPRLWTRIPSISVDQSDGRAYVTWASYLSNPSFGIEVMTSIDGGRNWSPTTHVTPFQLADSLQPSIAAENGVARAIWYETPDLGNTYDVLWSESGDGGMSWSLPERLNTESFSGAGQLGDYIWIDVAAGKVAAIWTDLRSGDASDIYVRTGTALGGFGGRAKRAADPRRRTRT